MEKAVYLLKGIQADRYTADRRHIMCLPIGEKLSGSEYFIPSLK